MSINHNFTTKYLGVTMYRSLAFKKRLENSLKVGSRVNVFKKLVDVRSWVDHVLRTVSLALVYCTAEYCSPVRLNMLTCQENWYTIK